MKVELLLNDAGFDDSPSFFRVHLEHAVEVFRHVDDDRVADGLSGQAGSGASRKDRHLEIAGDFHRGEDVFVSAGNHDADRLDFVDAGVGAVEIAGGASKRTSPQTRFFRAWYRSSFICYATHVQEQSLALRSNWKREDCPPESGGQRDREADPARGGSKTANFRRYGFGTTPALRATPPGSGAVFLNLLFQFTTFQSTQSAMKISMSPSLAPCRLDAQTSFFPSLLEHRECVESFVEGDLLQA